MAPRAIEEGGKTPLTTDEKFAAMLEVLQAALVARPDGALTPEVLKEILASNSTAVQKALKPENTDHPGISVYSHPDGDRKTPKQPLPYQVFHNGYPVHRFPETETWREWELYGQVQPGEFTVMRKDGTLMKVTVEAKYDAGGKIAQLEIRYPVLRAESILTPPKTVLLWQLIYPDNPRKRFLEAMQMHLNELFADPVSV